MASSNGLDFSALDNLLHEAEALDQHMRTAHPELYRMAAGQEAFSSAAQSTKQDASFDAFSDAGEAPPLRRSALAPEPEEEILPDIDENNLQAYFLRRKFEHLNEDSRFERAPAPEAVSRMSDAPAQLPDEELFLFALTRLSAGVSEEANAAVALMDQRPGMNPLLAFLPAYTAAQNGASRSRISDLIKRSLPAHGDDSGREMALLSQRILVEVINVITEAEALQEAGYRNRQEALAKAAQSVRQRLSTLT